MSRIQLHRVPWFVLSLTAAAVVTGTLVVSVLATERGILGPPPATQPTKTGPDVVMLRELQQQFEPVPFNHKTHAEMSLTTTGCSICHHKSPEETPTPACKSCHPATRADLKQPGLKGAYHRQCLNCHREWAHENQCQACHKAKPGTQPPQVKDPTPDDILGRMHPPIPEPETVSVRVQFTPADGKNVLFRHKEHIDQFGFKCVNCHRESSCSRCHEGKEQATAMKQPVRLTRTWDEAHERCFTCHKGNKCKHCHYKDGQAAPQPFDHMATGQGLDAKHTDLSCIQCHVERQLGKVDPTCGGSKCHEKEAVAFPAKRPGPMSATQARVREAGGANRP